MKLSDFITDIGRPVAFYPGLKRITKSTTATILLCQFIYWIGKGESKDGSVYKTSKELEDETGLTYEEQKTARARLKDIGLLTEKYARLDHTIYFKIDTNKLDALWASSQCHDGENGNDTMANKVLPDSLNSNTETTSNTTTKNTSFSKNEKEEPILEPCNDDGIPDSWREVKTRKPNISENEQRLAKLIADTLGIKPPICNTRKEYAAAQVTWWKPIKEMLRQVDQNIQEAESIADCAIEDFRKARLTMTSPKSVLSGFIAVMVREKNGH
jgi:hypothetical protein